MKFKKERAKINALMSRPTRGAWIEIDNHIFTEKLLGVAPHTGRVD